MKEATRKVILRLKEVKSQKGLSQQDIFEMCANRGEYVSQSSIRRVFAKGSEDGPDFRQSTIDPIFHAIIGTEQLELTDAEEAALSETEKEVIVENAALKAMVEMKDASIGDLSAQILRLNEEKDSLTRQLADALLRYDTAVDLVRSAMESFGRGSRQH